MSSCVIRCTTVALCIGRTSIGESNQKSDCKRKLDDFFRPLWTARQKGTRFDQPFIKAELQKELGPDEVKRLRAELIDGTETHRKRSAVLGLWSRMLGVRATRRIGNLLGLSSTNTDADTAVLEYAAGNYPPVASKKK